MSRIPDLTGDLGIKSNMIDFLDQHTNSSLGSVVTSADLFATYSAWTGRLSAVNRRNFRYLVNAAGIDCVRRRSGFVFIDIELKGSTS